jgi:hypothetical protein
MAVVSPKMRIWGKMPQGEERRSWTESLPVKFPNDFSASQPLTKVDGLVQITKDTQFFTFELV